MVRNLQVVSSGEKWERKYWMAAARDEKGPTMNCSSATLFNTSTS